MKRVQWVLNYDKVMNSFEQNIVLGGKSSLWSFRTLGNLSTPKRTFWNWPFQQWPSTPGFQTELSCCIVGYCMGHGPQTFMVDHRGQIWIWERGRDTVYGAGTVIASTVRKNCSTWSYKFPFCLWTMTRRGPFFVFLPFRSSQALSPWGLLLAFTTNPPMYHATSISMSLPLIHP